jgi:hypothetical protein
MGGNDILNVRRLVGIANNWTIEEDGSIKTRGLIKTVIDSYQNEKVETNVVTSTDVFVTMVGTANLENGEAIVSFDDIDQNFNDIISTTAPIRVVATPNGPVSLYVPEKNNNGFLIKQIDGNNSEISVDWMVTAYRKDYEPKEKTEVTETPKETQATVPQTIETTEMAEVTSETPQTTEVTETTFSAEQPVDNNLNNSEATITNESITETTAITEPASSESLTQSNDPAVEGDGGTETEPPSTEPASTTAESSTQTESQS